MNMFICAEEYLIGITIPGIICGLAQIKMGIRGTLDIGVVPVLTIVKKSKSLPKVQRFI